MSKLTDDEIHQVKESLIRSCGKHIVVVPIDSLEVVPDSTHKIAVYKGDVPIAFVIVSSSISPEQMVVADSKLNACANLLPPFFARRLMKARELGRTTTGRSYAIYPYCFSLGSDKWSKLISRIYVGPFLLCLALVLSRRSMRRRENDMINTSVVRESLLFFMALPNLDSRLTHDVSQMVNQECQLFKYFTVASHGDYWIGNAMIEPMAGNILARRGVGGIKIIDFGGYQHNGVFLFDTLRLLESINAPALLCRTYIRYFLWTHGVSYSAARESLICGLAEMSKSLDHFPVDRFVIMVNSILRFFDDNTND